MTNISRRALLRVSLATTAALVAHHRVFAQATSSPTAPARSPNNTATSPQLPSIEQAAAAYERSFRLSEGGRLLATYAYIATQQGLVERGQKTRIQAVADIKAAIEKNQYEFPKEFGDLARWFDSNPDISKAFVRTLSIGGLGAAGGALALFANPPAFVTVGGAAALATLGVLTDSVIDEHWASVYSYLVPPPTSQEVLNLSVWAAAAYRDKFDKSNTSREITNELLRTGHLKLPNTSKSQLKKGALNELLLRAIAGKAGAAGQSASQVRQAAADAVGQELLARLKEFDSIVRDHRLNHLAEIASRRRQEAIEYTINEIVGFGATANFIVTTVFKAPSEGQRIQTFATAAAQVYMAATSPVMGPWATAGALAGAALNIIALESKKQVWQEALIARLDAVIERLDWIAENQLNLLKLCREIYQKTLENSTTLTSLQNTLVTFAADAHEAQVANARQSLIQSKDRLSVLLREYNSLQIQANPNRRLQYENDLTALYTFSHRTAREPILSISERPLQREETTARIRARQRCDQLVEALVAIAGVAQIGVAPAASVDDDPRPVNPIAWAEGVRAFLEAEMLVDGGLRQANEHVLQTLWWDGWRIGELVRTIVTPKAVNALRMELLKAAGFDPAIPPKVAEDEWNPLPRVSDKGLSGMLSRKIVEWDKKNVKRSLAAQWALQGRWTTFESSQFAVKVNFVNDFVAELIAKKMLVLENPRRHGAINAHRLKVSAPGRLQGIELGEVGWNANPGYNLWYFPLPEKPSYGSYQPTELQQRARTVALELIYRPIAIGQDGLPQTVADTFNSLGEAANAYNFFGELLRVLTTFCMWRASPYEFDSMCYLANAVGPYSTKEVPSFINQYVRSKLSFAGYWPSEILVAWHTSINRACDDTIALFADFDERRSLPIVDVTMRRLTTFMAAKGYKLPEPPTKV